MQGGRDPFSGFGNLFGSHRSLMSSFFGGKDPFDDPFFTQPFGGMFGSSLFGADEQHFMGMNHPGFPPMFMGSSPAGFIEQPARSRGPIIEELNSDDEKEDKGTNKKQNPRKHGRLSEEEPIVHDPDDETEERMSKQMNYGNEFRQMQQFQPQAQSFSFQSSTVTYGGANGAYYTSSRTMRKGSDGLTFEECKEADSTTGKANHKISRGIHDKGHSVIRKLGSDGRVETMQALHNINQEELAGFEEDWKGKAKMHLPGWMNGHGAAGGGSRGGGGGGWALPSTESGRHHHHHHQNPTKKLHGHGGDPGQRKDHKKDGRRGK